MDLDYAQKKRKFENDVAHMINLLWVVKNQTNIAYEKKLEAVLAIERAMPRVRRWLIYFQNIEVKK